MQYEKHVGALGVLDKSITKYRGMFNSTAVRMFVRFVTSMTAEQLGRSEVDLRWK